MIIVIAIVISFLVGILLGIFFGGVKIQVIVNNLESEKRKIARNNKILIKWIKDILGDADFSTKIAEAGFKEISIYGMGELGILLCKELENSPISIKYAIDKRADMVCSKVPVFFPTDELENVDAVVICVQDDSGEIKKSLSQKLTCPIVSIESFI